MANWILVTGFPYSGQNLIYKYLWDDLFKNYKCFDFGWLGDQGVGIKYAELDNQYDFVLLKSINYITNITRIIPENNLLIYLCVRDLRDAIAQSMNVEKKAFELVFSKWTVNKIIYDLEQWKNHHNVLTSVYETLLENLNLSLMQIHNFLKDTVKTIKINKNYSLENKRDLLESYKEYLDDQPGIWKTILSKEELGIIQYHSAPWLRDNKFKIEKTIYNYRFFWSITKTLNHLKNHTLLHRLFFDNFNSRIKRMLALETSKNGFIFYSLENKNKMKLYNDSRISQLIISRNYEYNERNFVKRYLKKGDIFIDIGASVGLYTLLSSKYVGKNGKVYAFEPAAKTFLRLEENIKLNNLKNVVAIKGAVSDKTGNSTFYSDIGEYDAWNSLSIPSTGLMHQKEFVKTYTLDLLLQKFDLKSVKLIKIDVEGFEVPVLRGGIKMLSSNDPPALLVEFTEENAINAGFSCREEFEFCINLGYNWYSYDSNSNTLIRQSLKDHYPYENLIALKNISGLNIKTS